MLSLVTESVPPNNSWDSFTISTCEGQIQGNNPNSMGDTQQVMLREYRTSNTYWAIALCLILTDAPGKPVRELNDNAKLIRRLPVPYYPECDGG